MTSAVIAKHLRGHIQDKPGCEIIHVNLDNYILIKLL